MVLEWQNHKQVKGRDEVCAAGAQSSTCESEATSWYKDVSETVARIWYFTCLTLLGITTQLRKGSLWYNLFKIFLLSLFSGLHLAVLGS